MFVGGGRRSMGEGGKNGSAVYPVHLSLRNPLDLGSTAPQDNLSVSDVLRIAGMANDEQALRKIAEANLASGYAFVSPSQGDAAGYLARQYQGRGRASNTLDDPGLMAALQAAGFDGLVMKEEGVKTFAAFSPEQVKSAIGNRGTFDPADPDIRFSRTTDAAKAVGDTLKSITVSNVKQRAGFKLTDYLGIGLQALGRRQIVDIYGDLVPLAEYNRLVQQMEADKNEGGAEADQLVTRWAKLSDEGKLANLMHDATLAQIDPAKPYEEGGDKAKYTMLRGQFNALTDAAKQVYTDTRDSYQAHHAKVRSAIKERIERSEIRGERKAALLKQMDDEFFKAIKGVYFLWRVSASTP